MTTTYDLYGVEAHNLEDVRAAAEKALGISMTPHESGLHCGAYYRGGSLDGEHVIVQRNYDETEGEWTETEHHEVPFLVYVNETVRGDELKSLLLQSETFAHLRRETF